MDEWYKAGLLSGIMLMFVPIVIFFVIISYNDIGIAIAIIFIAIDCLIVGILFRDYGFKDDEETML